MNKKLILIFFILISCDNPFHNDIFANNDNTVTIIINSKSYATYSFKSKYEGSSGEDNSPKHDIISYTSTSKIPKSGELDNLEWKLADGSITLPKNSIRGKLVFNKKSTVQFYSDTKLIRTVELYNR